jgi:hypothetical protein
MDGRRSYDPGREPQTPLDALCFENLGQRFCPTSGRCYDPRAETCLEPAYGPEPAALPPCVRSAEERCRRRFGDLEAAAACRAGARQAVMPGASLQTRASAEQQRRLPLAFSEGGAYGSELCHSSGGTI